MTPTEPATRTLTESAIQRGIRDCLESLGFAVFHTRFALGSDPGFPDLIGVGCKPRTTGLLVAVELKGPKGQIRPGQVEWLERFRAVPGCIFAEIVGPRDAVGWWGYDSARLEIQRAVEAQTEAAE